MGKVFKLLTDFFRQDPRFRDKSNKSIKNQKSPLTKPQKGGKIVKLSARRAPRSESMTKNEKIFKFFQKRY